MQMQGEGGHMLDSTAVLRDVELRLRALEDARQLQAMVDAAMAQLTEAKRRTAESEPGSLAEQQYLREAVEASSRLGLLREQLYGAQRELRRTAYLLELLAE
jgi:hypothetical protein